MSRSARPVDRRILVVILLLALLCLAQAHTCLAVNAVIWRELSLSWDNPATLLLEWMALEPVPHTVTRDTDVGVQAEAQSARHLSLAPRPDAPVWLLAFARVTRAPPAA
jgi:hypothetical protein